jgi:class 3 adenylate cyclase/tetratricopeptide (TPR) repeat protein
LATEQLERRLTAILAADVAGYSRLTGLDEEGTHVQLREHLCSLVDPKIAEHRGRIVKNTGDGLLAEFGSVVDAVRCAIDVQRGMAGRNVKIPRDRRIEFRIGINVGDIIVDRGDIFGDGVNIAARLESLAEAGGILLSDDAYRQVRGKLGVRTEDLGEHQLKNIAQHVRVHRVLAEHFMAGERQPSHVGHDDSVASLQSAVAGGLTFAGEVFTQSNITMRVPTHFLGRDDALAEIEQALARRNGRVAITALHGLRGVGKTTLAAAYADCHRADYRAIWWIRAQTTLSMRADLVAVGVRLGWVRADDKLAALPEEATFAAVMERLHHDGEGILLIYDNAIDADALKPFLPRGGVARVLVTSNAHAWRGVAEPVEIRLWPKQIGANYLVARTGRTFERAAAEALSEVLGGLPLAHEQAAAYCERLDISLGEYRKRFEAAPVRLLDDARHAPTEYHDGRTVARTFGLAIEEAAKLHPAAEPLIVHAALLAPEPIPLFLFSEAREKFGEPLATALTGDGLDEAMAALRAFALVDREAIVDERDASIATDAIRLHRLVREIAAARHDSEARDTLRPALVAALAAVYPEDGFNNPPAWPRCAPLTPHLLASCETEMADAATNAERAGLLDRAGNYFFGRANYLAARPLYERALAICEKVLGPEHPNTANSLSHLASLLEAQGDLAAARPLLERALAINEKVHGPEHPGTATGLNHLARLLQAQGDLAAARPLHERALAIREKVLGLEHPHTAWSLNNLAFLLKSMGEFATAKPLFDRALEVHEKVSGPEHPATAMVLQNLAALLHSQGDLPSARPLNERALEIRMKVLGPQHPDTAISLNDLGWLLSDQGDLAVAKALYERALAIFETVFGPEHPLTAIGLNNLAVVLFTQGDSVAARPLLERALAINEKVHGPEHPDTASRLSNLAVLLNKAGDASEAEPLFHRAITISGKALGRGHTRTQRYVSHYARLLLDTSRAAEALPLAQTALATHEAASGPNHPWTKDSARVTADVLAALGRADEAAALRARYGLGDEK